MYIKSQSGTTLVDMVGLDIQVNQDATIFSIVAVGLNPNFNPVIASYPNELITRQMFDNIIYKMVKGEQFYDVMEEEKRFVETRGR